jgi:hypothetical protein
MPALSQRPTVVGKATTAVNGKRHLKKDLYAKQVVLTVNIDGSGKKMVIFFYWKIFL